MERDGVLGDVDEPDKMRRRKPRPREYVPPVIRTDAKTGAQVRGAE